jgi:long-chain fatty acid transport protein
MRRVLASLGASAIALTLAHVALANEADTYGLGSRAAAMGGAVAADAADFSGNYYNPGALASAPGLEIAIGYTYAANHLRIDGQDNDVDAMHGIVGGLVAPGKILGVPFAFGIGTFLPDSGLSSIKAIKQETPRWALYDGRSGILFLAANLAVKPVSWLEIGGGAAFLAATQGKFGIKGTADIESPYDSDLHHEVDAGLTAVRYPEVGARVKVGSLGYLALVYRGETKLHLSIAADLEGNISLGGLMVPLSYVLSSTTIDAFLPQQVVLGASFQKIERLKVNFDLTFVNWAAYESPTAQTNADLEVTVPPGLNVQIPPQPKPTAVVPPSFANRFVPRIGVEYVLPAFGPARTVKGTGAPTRMIEIPLRAGYVFEASPVPPQTGTTNFVDADRHTVSAGLGIELHGVASWMPGTIAVDAHAQLSILPERVTQKTSAADFVGDYKASGDMIGGGATLSARF